MNAKIKIVMKTTIKEAKRGEKIQTQRMNLQRKKKQRRKEERKGELQIKKNAVSNENN